VDRMGWVLLLVVFIEISSGCVGISKHICFQNKAKELVEGAKPFR